MKRSQAAPASMPNRPELSDTPIKLCNEISRLFRHRLREREDNDPLFSEHGARLILSFLATKDGVTQRELVCATHLRAPTVSVILRRMEEADIVKREADAHDQRAIRVFLTEKGREVDRRNIERIKTLDGEILCVLSEQENEQLMILLRKIRDQFLTLTDSTEGREEAK